jgi:lantibiotic biosynthesis protein
MNGTYSFHNKLVLRTPRLPLVHTANDSLIQELLWDNSFLEAIYLASPVLHDECIKWRSGQITAPKDIHKLTRSILKYYTRMCSRCTPFGLFSGHTLVEWNEGNTNVVVDNDKFGRHTRFDMHYLCALAQQLASVPSIKEKLLYFPNNSLYNVGDEIRYIEYKYLNAKRIHQISSVTASDYLQHILSSAATGLTIADMSNQLVSDEISSEDAIDFIDELINAQLLVSELEPSITGPEFIHQVINTLERISNDEAGLIATIISILKEANNALQQLDVSLTNEASAYRSIMQTLNKLQVPYEENKLFQVDTSAITKKNSVDVKLQQQLQEGMEVLNKLMPPQGSDNLQSFARRFHSRYEDREMPLLEVLDTETGIGYLEQGSESICPLVEDIVLTGKSTEERLSWGTLENFWKTKLIDAVKHNRYCIEISDKDLKDFSSNWNDLPPSMTVLFKILDTRNNLIYLENAGGSSAAALLGRFAHASQDVNDLVCEITAKEQQLDPGIVYAEIIHLPESRTGNVLLHPAFREYEIPYMAKSSLDNDHQIDVKDLYVSVKQNRVILRSKKLNKEIVPRLSSAHNYHHNSLPVYQFLGDLQLQDKRRGIQLSWGSLQRQHSFLPRVMYGNTILHLATWQFLKKDTAHLHNIPPAELMETVSLFRREWKMPRHVVLADGDNELLIDLENEQLVQLLLETTKNRGQFTLKEFFYTDNQCITNGKGQSYANQLAAIVVKNTGSYNPAKNIDQQKEVARKFSPGSEWVYFKLYCGAKSADKILLEAIKPLTEKLAQENKIDKWFFIRYNDPDFHLRLRLHVAESRNIGDVITQVNAFISPFEKSGYIWKLQMDTYNREVERYGFNTIELSETLFCHDSNAMLALLDNTWGDAREQARWVWGLRAIDELLNSFQLTLQNKLSLLTELKNAFAAEFNMDKLLKMQLDQKHRANKKVIEQILDSSNDLLNELSPLIDIIKEKSANIESVTETILDIQAEGELQVPLADLLNSYIHMLLNRLFPSNQRLHEMVAYDFLFRYYQSATARKKKEQVYSL